MPHVLPLEQLRKAIYLRVKSDLALDLYPLATPPDTPVPYAVITRVGANTADRTGTTDVGCSAQVEVFDLVKNGPAVADTLNDIAQSLLREKLTLEGGYRDIGLTEVDEGQLSGVFYGEEILAHGTLRITFHIARP